MNRAAFLSIVVASASLVYAQERGDRPPGGPPTRMSPLVQALDTDHDGVISAEEIRNAPTALKALVKNADGTLTEADIRPAFRMRPGGEGREGGEQRDRANAPDDMVKTLMAFDKNNDGKLTKDEVPERMQGLFDRGDLNHDGVLTVEEIQKMVAAQAPNGGGGGERRGPAGPGGPGGGFMRFDPVASALDANHDGVIDANEIRGAAAALKTLDKNGDGQLTEDELRPNFRGRGRQDGPR